MVLEADRNGVVVVVLVLAAALAIQDPRERPTGKEQAAAEAHARFADASSDFVAYLNLWAHIQQQQKELSSSQFRKLCRTEFLNYLRVREWQDLHSQLRRVATNQGLRLNDGAAGDEAVHQSVLAGLLSHVGLYDATKQEYQGARGARFAVARGSALGKKRPQWVMAAELVETNRLWARTVARIEPAWAERAGAHLTKRTYGEPWWDERRGAAVTDERVHLFGLPVVAARRVPYSRVDPAVARDLFLQHALVLGEWQGRHDFIDRNARRIEEVGALEDRVRRRDILVTDQELLDLYDARVGPDVTSARHFDRWWKQERTRRPDLLDLDVAELVDPGAGPIDLADFPESWTIGDVELRLSYRFEPGHVLDGVTVDVPIDVLDRIDGAPLTWQVPGHREELVTALVRSLPKVLRRHFVPVPEHVARVLSGVGPSDGPLPEVLARELARLVGEGVPADAWQLDQIPPHLLVTYRAVADDGRPLAWSKDLVALRTKLRSRARVALSEALPGLERTGQRTWTFGSIARAVESQRDGRTVTARPALVDEKDAVGLRLVATAEEQERLMRAGTRRLLLLGLGPARRALEKGLSNETKLALAGSGFSTVAGLLDDVAAAVVDHELQLAGGPAWDADAYATLESALKAGFAKRAAAAARAAGRTLLLVRGIEVD
ncbi:MAG: ATP-dependent RNA helicase HrpA, partial [Actinomycetota bacterium]|nr:ATP-dependent RNA helicase HrpA [Actinomycetota bacterium]